MTYLYIYRMTDDTGFAPCLKNGLLTLACCKGGQIRDGKVIHTGLRYRIGSGKAADYSSDDVYILGTYGNKLLYLAKVTRVTTMEEYYSALSEGRLDDIYSMNDGQLVRNDKLRKENVHTEEDRVKRDLAGTYVLMSDDYLYLGSDAVYVDIVAKYNARFHETKTYKGKQAEKIIAECLKHRDGKNHVPTSPYRGKSHCR